MLPFWLWELAVTSSFFNSWLPFAHAEECVDILKLVMQPIGTCGMSQEIAVGEGSRPDLHHFHPRRNAEVGVGTCQKKVPAPSDVNIHFKSFTN